MSDRRDIMGDPDPRLWPPPRMGTYWYWISALLAALILMSPLIVLAVLGDV